MSNTREFEYKGKQVKIAATKIAGGRFVAVPIIDGEVAKAGTSGNAKRSVNEALGEAEKQARNLIDRQA